LSEKGNTKGSALRAIPAIGSLLERAEVHAMARRYSRGFVTALVREAVEDLRREVAAGRAGAEEVARFATALPRRLEEAAARRLAGRLSPLLNATGVIVHTNLGRSPLPGAAIERMQAAAAGYCDLEYRLESGERGSRQDHLEALLLRLFPGKKGLVVNNNAGAVLLALNTLAEGREVLISRGELVEIGGSFRIPDVMAKSGAILREVGTTNRTRLGDFENAMSDRTGLLLKVHTSNYRIVGFVEEAPLPDLAALGRRRGIPVLVDQGSGKILDLSEHGLRDEPAVASLLDQGADVVTFSGDKLLGGPQAGILIGREDLILEMKSNPLYRALRPDKITLAGLEATLEIFVAGNPVDEVPALRMLSRPAREIRARSERLAGLLREECGGALELRIEDGVSRVGGGAAPLQEIPTALLALRPRALTAEAYEAALRTGRPPVIARVREGWLLLDLRTVGEDEETALAGALRAALP